MSFLCRWFALLLVQSFFLQLVDSKECDHDSVYVTGPLPGVFKVCTPGSESGPAHGNRPIYESLGTGSKHFLYYADGYWIFGVDLLGGTEEYFSSSDAECPDDAADWYAQNYNQASIEIRQVASEGMCPLEFPACEKGDCRKTDVLAPLSFAPDYETGRLGGAGVNAIHGSTGDKGGLKCNQHFEACPKNYPICLKRTNQCWIAECVAGIESGGHIACKSPNEANSPNDAPWRCTDPWRCLPDDSSISNYNLIKGFDGTGRTACKTNYEVRKCPKNFPVCNDGNCVIEDCTDGCLVQGVNRLLGFDGSGTTCNRNYQVEMCPKSYPACFNENCFVPKCSTGTCTVSQAPHLDSPPGDRYNSIDGYDAKGAACKESYQVAASCPLIYPKCVRGNCRTSEDDAGHPVLALYTFTPIKTCQEKSGQPCNGILGYDGLGAKCDQDFQACPALYPYCELANGHCLLAECRTPNQCSTPYKMADSSTTKYIGKLAKPSGILGYDVKGGPCKTDYKVRRCPDDYPACYQGDCVVESCKPGPNTDGEPCAGAWKNAYVNPLNPRIPPPDSKVNRISGYNGLGDICNEGFEVECPSNYPVCFKDGSCVITQCKDGLDNSASATSNPPCNAWHLATSPSDPPWPDLSARNQFQKFQTGRIEVMEKCNKDYEVSMCAFHYPFCVMSGEHEGDCITEVQHGACKAGTCNAWAFAPAFDTSPSTSYSYVYGTDSWGTPCNKNYEEIVVKLLASEQDLLFWLTGVKAWHTSLQIGNMEYWYDPENGGTIKEETAGHYTSHIYGQSGLVPNRRGADKVTIHEFNLGPTSKSVRVMKRQLEKLFTFPDSGYDVIYRNSNTFTDFALWALLGYRLSSAWFGKDWAFSYFLCVEAKLIFDSVRDNNGDEFSFQRAEATVRDSTHGKYDKIRELFQLLGKNLERKGWYDMYICTSAQEATRRAWEDPSLRPNQGFAIADQSSESHVKYPLEHRTIPADVGPNLLGRGGANELTKADSVVPKDLRSFLHLVDLLMANCVSLLYNEQVKLAEKWHEIDHSAPMNPLSELDESYQNQLKNENAAKWAAQDEKWRANFGENSHQPEAGGVRIRNEDEDVRISD